MSADSPTRDAPFSVPLLEGGAVRDRPRAYRNLAALKQSLGETHLNELLPALSRCLPRQADPDMALNNLERFLAQPAGREQLPLLLEGRSRGLEVLLQLFSASQFFSDLLVTNPDYLEVIRVPLRRSPALGELVQQLRAEAAAAPDDSALLRAFRRFRQRHHLRIGVNDVIRDRTLEEITRDLSNIAESSVEVALEIALRSLGHRFGVPYTADGHPARVAVLAFGKLGGEELNYSSDIDLMFVYDEPGFTRGRKPELSNDEFFSRAVAEVIRLLSVRTDRGHAYRVDLRLRPEGERGPVIRSLASTLTYYDTLGRTWERQALIKVRPIAGDRALGEEFLRQIEPFVYRRYLTFAEINEIKALKRRLEQHAQQAGDSEREVKTGRGGIRDIEFSIQFLQLLNGGDMPAVRRRNTLEAMQALETAGCLSDPEYRILDDAYRFLRKTEHRLQLLFDLQTHRLPDSTEELRKLALRMGYSERGARSAERGTEMHTSERGTRNAERGTEIRSSEALDSGPEGTPQRLFGSALRAPSSELGPQKHSPLDEPTSPPLDTKDLLLDPMERFLHDYLEKTRLNRTILDHLLHQTFAAPDERAEPESDLLLAPEADESTVRAALGRYPFEDVMGAYRNLTQLAQEAGPFLSDRRCRHFLASIAPQLLRALAETPDPDLALLNLEQVTASLGAKAVLWELFSFNPPSLRLYVDLCSNSPFLSQILINNPGMIDDLLDSLILNQRRAAEELRAELRELVRGVDKPEVIEPILHSFQDKEQLRIGVRDLLGKDDVRQTTAALSDLAETLLAEVLARQEPIVPQRFGVPILADGPRSGAVSRYVVLALGKLGGREMSYHSDLDLIVVYEGDGRTAPPPAERHASFTATDNFHYFTELAQRAIRAMSQMGPMGRLYAVDMRLRPTGKSGSLVIPLAEFRRYYEGPSAMVWERQSLTRARVVHGDAAFGEDVMTAVRAGIHGQPWRPEVVDEIRSMRARLESTASPRSLKRGPGAMTDVEFLVQLFQIKYGREKPAICQTNTWQSLDALRHAGLLDAAEHTALRESYSFQRLAEARLRIVTNRALNEYPESVEDLEKLARRMGFEAKSGASAAERFRAELKRHTAVTRELFVKLTERER
jgi:glutamate-ammonia-ligase adenylyltransferase